MDIEYFKNILKRILDVDSPTGYTIKMSNEIKSIIEKLGYNVTINNRGNCIIHVDGVNEETTLICAHIDTLGFIVKGIKANGALEFSRIGLSVLPSVDSENCRIYTRDNKMYEGTILSIAPSFHVNRDCNSLERNENTLEVKIDELVKNKDDVLKLGISNGDFICIDPKVKITDSGYIKSRFLDDKLCVAIIITLLKYYKDNNVKPNNNLEIIFSNGEEVAKAVSGVDDNIKECLVLDMGCIGKGLECNENMVSICAKDTGGPYDYEMISKLVNIAKKTKISYAIDVYPIYSSDATVILKSGKDIRCALIGPGIYASHGYERTHIDSAKNTFDLLLNYLYL